MNFTKVVFSKEARNLLVKGLNTTADAVGCTLGPKGKTVLIHCDDKPPIVTKDGVTVSKSIKLRGKLERIGSSLIQEAASRTNEVAGDGTTTATILTQALVTQSVKFLAADLSSLAIKKGLRVGVETVVAELKALAKPIKETKEIEQIATISANNDEHIGKLIATAMNVVGKNGIITVEDAKGMNTTVDIVEGMQFDRGYLSPYFVNDQEKMLAVYENTYVLICDGKIGDVHELIPILERVMQSRKPLLIVAEEIEGTALQGLVLNRHQNQLPVVAIKAPGYGEYKNDLLADICKLTGAKIVSAKSGLTLKEVSLKDLGKLQKFVVSKSTTTMVGDGSQKEEVEQHVENLNLQLSDVTLTPEQYDKLRRRIAGLANGVAIIKVGGTTELEMIEKKYRIEDALHATKAAADEGVVPGGGIALVKACRQLDNVRPPDDETDPDGFMAGIKLIKHACSAPLRKIIENTGGSFDALIKDLPTGDNMGYDALKGVFVDMLKEGIIDPVLVTRTALQNAASVADTFLSFDAVVFDDDSEGSIDD